MIRSKEASANSSFLAATTCEGNQDTRHGSPTPAASDFDPLLWQGNSDDL